MIEQERGSLKIEIQGRAPLLQCVYEPSVASAVGLIL